MSISNPRLENPCKKFIEFKGDTGIFQYYDKDKGENFQLQTPFYFIVLDELSSIRGYNKFLKTGLYSNEIRSIKNDVLNVRSFKGGLQIIGKYSDIKDRCFNEGGKFSKSVYALLITAENEYELVNFQFHGASFSGVGEKSQSGWMNKKFNVEKMGVKVAKTEMGAIGKTKFSAPIFQPIPIQGKHQKFWDIAIEEDKKLQKYLNAYLDKKVEEEIIEVVAEEQTEPEDGMDFTKVKEEAVNSPFNETDVSDDLPF